MDISQESLALHYKLRGKLEVVSRYPIQTQKDLSLAYTPGVAAPCLEIQKDPAKSFQLTRRQNLVAVITDGSAVLGLGTSGPGGDAGDGGQVRPLQGVRRGGRLPPVRGHPGCGRDGGNHRPDLQKASGASTWRTSPPPVLRGGAPAERGLRHPPSFTTTSTAPPW